jgi:hypothetical protein
LMCSTCDNYHDWLQGKAQLGRSSYHTFWVSVGLVCHLGGLSCRRGANVPAQVASSKKNSKDGILRSIHWCMACYHGQEGEPNLLRRPYLVWFCTAMGVFSVFTGAARAPTCFLLHPRSLKGHPSQDRRINFAFVIISTIKIPFRIILFCREMSSFQRLRLETQPTKHQTCLPSPFLYYPCKKNSSIIRILSQRASSKAQMHHFPIR